MEFKNKFLKYCVLVGAVGVFLNANTFNKSEALKKISNITIFKSKDLKPVDIKKIDGTDMYFVLGEEMRGKHFFNILVAKNGMFMVGRAFDKNGKPILFKQQIPKPINMKKFEGKEAFVVGTGKKDYYIFTDPKCPFCTGLEAFMPKLEKIGKFHVFFFPLDQLHPTARSAAAYVMSLPKEKRAQGLRKIMLQNDNTFLSTHPDKKFYKMVKDSEAVGNKLHVRGTPTIYDAKGQMIDTSLLLGQVGVSSNDFMMKVRELAEKEKKINGHKKIAPPIVPSANKDKLLNPKMLKLFDEKKISIVMGGGNKDVYVFMSTQCPHCKKMYQSKEMNALLRKYRFHFIVSPLPGNVESKYETAYLLLKKGKSRAKAFDEIMKSKKHLSDKDKTIIEKQLGKDKSGVAALIAMTGYVLSKNKIDEVPTIVSVDGKIIQNFSLKAK